MFDYTKLKQRIKEKGFSYKTLAIKVNIRLSALEEKLNSHIVFTQNEIQKLTDVLEICAKDVKEYFFTQ